MKLKERFILRFHKFSNRVNTWKRQHRVLGVLGVPVLAAYNVLVEGVLGVELPAAVSVGAGFRLFHGVGLVVHPAAVIGAEVTLRQCTTIGTKRLKDGTESGAPILEDRVDVGANAVIIGPVTVGEGAIVGAGAVVTRDVACGVVVAGNPARPLCSSTKNAGEP